MMEFRRILQAACLIVALVLLPGCGRRQQKPLPSEETAGHIEPGELPKLSAPIGPLDEDRIQVAPPENWFTPLRDSRWLIRFQASDKTRYPSIFISAEDYENVFNVSEDNVDEFARQISAAMEADGTAARLAEDVRPVKIGEFAGITYRRRGKDKGRIIERVFVETVVSGRKYTVELQAREGTLQMYRPHVHAVAGGIKFIQANPPEPPKKEPTENDKSREAEPEAERNGQR